MAEIGWVDDKIFRKSADIIVRNIPGRREKKTLAAGMHATSKDPPLPPSLSLPPVHYSMEEFFIAWFSRFLLGHCLNSNLSLSTTRRVFSSGVLTRIAGWYSQTWEIRPPKGLGVSGPIFQVVSFARFWSKIFKMELYTCPSASHDISDRWFPRVTGGVIGNDHAKRSLKTRRSLVRSACEGKLGNQNSVFRCNLTHVVALCRLNRRFGPTFGVRNSH